MTIALGRICLGFPAWSQALAGRCNKKPGQKALQLEASGMTRFYDWVSVREPVSRSLSMTLTLGLGVGCWLVLGIVARWLLG